MRTFTSDRWALIEISIQNFNFYGGEWLQLWGEWMVRYQSRHDVQHGTYNTSTSLTHVALSLCLLPPPSCRRVLLESRRDYEAQSPPFLRSGIISMISRIRGEKLENLYVS